MQRISTLVLLLPVLFAGCGNSPEAQTPQDSAVVASAPDPANPSVPDSSAFPDSVRRPPQPLVPTPEVVRALYVNRWAAIGRRVWQLVDVAKTTEVNALVIDVKDDRGLMLYRSQVALAREIGADTTQPMSYARVRTLLDSMRAHGIYPIARIVIAKDPLLAEHRPQWAIRSRQDVSSAWLDRSGKPWLDPYRDEIWDYAVEISREAVNLGFSEIQLDYLRFPDERGMASNTTFPLAAGRTRADVVREQLGRMRDALAPLGVPITADVFGLTTTDTTDMGIGQRWEQFADQVDVVLPMTYPSHYAPGTYGIRTPNAQPYAVIDHALADARARNQGIAGAAQIIPWYQDFTLGPPRYGVEQVRAQIEAGYHHGIRSWMLWNPGSRYTTGALRPKGSDMERRTPPPVRPWRVNRAAGAGDTTRAGAAADSSAR